VGGGAGPGWRRPRGERPADREPFRGEVSALVSPLGMEFSVMSASPQAISGRNPNQPAAVWLVVLLKGEASFFDGETTTELEVGDITYGPSGVNAALRLATPFRLLFISAPRVAPGPRVIRPPPPQGRAPAGRERPRPRLPRPPKTPRRHPRPAHLRAAQARRAGADRVPGRQPRRRRRAGLPRRGRRRPR